MGERRRDIQHNLCHYHYLFLCMYSLQTLLVCVTEHAGGLCQNFDSYRREAEHTDRVADKWGDWIYFSISQTLASKIEIDFLSVLVILQFCKQYNLETVSTSPKLSFQFHLLGLPITLYFCECLKPMKKSAADKGSVLIFPSPGQLFCSRSFLTVTQVFGHWIRWGLKLKQG